MLANHAFLEGVGEADFYEIYFNLHSVEVSRDVQFNMSEQKRGKTIENVTANVSWNLIKACMFTETIIRDLRSHSGECTLENVNVQLVYVSKI